MRALAGGIVALSWSMVSLVACGGSEADPPPGTEDDAGIHRPDTGVRHDAGDAGEEPEPDDSYPAAHLDFPLSEYGRGGLLLAPKIVTITFPGDPMRATLEQFGDTITQTAWWDAVRDGFCTDTAECIKRGEGGGHVVMPSPAATNYTAEQVDDVIRTNVGSILPEATPDTLYVIYFPPGATISDPDLGASCQTFGGYHTYTLVSDTLKVPYAVVPRCAFPGMSEQDTATVSSSHEIIEAATDPYPDTGYVVNDQAWASTLLPEVADMCNYDGYYLEGDTLVTRVWSNPMASAGGDPCAPAVEGDVYYNASPAKGEEAVSLAVGESVTIDVTAFSTGPMDAWQLYAVDNTEWFQQSDAVLGLSMDRQTAKNGDVAKLTITLKKPIHNGFAGYTIISAKDQNSYHLWPAKVVPR